MAQDEGQLLPIESSSQKTILLVEDDVDIGEVFVQVITQETPYQAVLVADGIEALHAVADITPNLFILDYRLPYMNGLELYDRLRAIEALEKVPAIMMSADLPQQELHKRKMLGIHKPIDLDEFLQVIEEILA